VNNIRRIIAKHLTLDPMWWNKVPKGMLPALDLGCGTHKAKGAYGLDISSLGKADVICDINEGYFPFKDSIFKLVYASHIIEHIEDPEKTLKEIHRVCKKGAHVLLRYPHFRSINAFSDVTHRRYLGFRAFDNYFLSTKKRTFFRWFRLLKRGIRLNRWLRRVGVEILMSVLLPRIEGWVFLLPFSQFDVFLHLEVLKVE